MSDQDGGLLAQSIDATDEVAGQMIDVIVFDIRRFICLTLATHVGCHDVITRIGEHRYLMPPGIPGFRPAMSQEH